MDKNFSQINRFFSILFRAIFASLNNSSSLLFDILLSKFLTLLSVNSLRTLIAFFLSEVILERDNVTEAIDLFIYDFTFSFSSNSYRFCNMFNILWDSDLKTSFAASIRFSGFSLNRLNDPNISLVIERILLLTRIFLILFFFIGPNLFFVIGSIKKRLFFLFSTINIFLSDFL